MSVWSWQEASTDRLLVLFFMFRVAQIGPYPQSADCIRGGVEASVYGLAQEQGKSMDVHVFDLPRIGEDNTVIKDGNVTVHRYNNPGKRQAFASLKVSKMIQEIKALNPDICHIHGTGLFAWLMYRGLTKEKQSVIVTIHGLLRIEKRNQLKARFSLKRFAQYLYQGAVEERLLKHLPVAIVDTEYVKQMILNYPIRKKPNMRVIPQGINEDFFSMECSCDSRILLSVGAMGRRKGHLHTLEAFEQLRRESVDAKLILVGTVAEPKYYDKMLQFVNRSNYKDDICIKPNLSKNELLRLYERAHVFVLHSEEESQGIVFAEAMATGMPVVSTTVGGVPFVVQQNVCGLLSEYGEAQAFKENMRTLLEDVQLWQSMSINSKRCAETYHWSIINKKIEELYHYIK